MAQVNLGHVKGERGETGSQGPQGIQGIQGVPGPAGPGCPTGGTAGQVLMKASGTDYEYLWSNINKSTHRTVPFAVGTNEWTLSSGVYTAEFTTAYITTTSFEELFMDNSFYTYGKAQIKATKKSGGGGLILTTATIPTGTITGTLKIIDTDDGKVPVIIEDTTVAIANGGTGQSSVAGVRAAFDIPDVVDNLTTNDGTKALSAKQGKTLSDQIGTLNNKIVTCPTFFYSSVSGDTSKSYTLSNNGRYVWYGFGNSDSRCAECMVYTHSSGAVTLKQVAYGSNISVTSSGNNSLTIANSSSNFVRGYFMIFDGTITEVTT